MLLLVAPVACSRQRSNEPAANEVAWDNVKPVGGGQMQAARGGVSTAPLGFDRNDFPGETVMSEMRGSFSFTGYWLNNPPGEQANSWKGKRGVLRDQGWGFLVLFNGRMDAEIVKARKAGTAPAELGRRDAAAAVAAARQEGFPAGTIIFLDQEEGGRLLDEQAAYLLAWTEAVASTPYKPGVYASAQTVDEGKGVMINTVRDIRERVRAQHLHPVAMFAYQDGCPPAPGCTLATRPLSDVGEPDLTAWQYAQSPRRPEITQSCAASYAADGNCYAPGFGKVYLDMDLATNTDPSHGR